MKSIITTIALFAALTFAASPAMAQGNVALGAGLDAAFPMGDFGDVANTGIGGVVGLEYGLSPNFNLLANFGFTSWGAKDNIINLDVNWSAIPVQFGGKFYPMPLANRFYVGAMAGFHRFSLDVPFYDPYSGITTTISASETKFGFAPMVGYEVGLGPTVLLDLGARYQMVSDDLNYVGLRAGLKFNLR